MKLPTKHGWTWRKTARAAAPGLKTPRIIWETTIWGMFYPDGSPMVVHVEFADHSGLWYVSDNYGAMRTSPAPKGVMGTLMARIEDFVDVDMTGDGHFFLTVEPTPARTLSRRIEQAAMRVASYSAFVAWAHQPPGWPPEIVITMTPAQAMEHGLLLRR